MNFDTLYDLGFEAFGISRSVSAENPSGAPGLGGSAECGVAWESARQLGKGWKVSPWADIPCQSRVVIADIEGPGIIQSIWMAPCAAREVILRIFWDGQLHPSVEAPLMEFFAYSWYKADSGTKAGPFFQLNSLVVQVNPNRGLNCFWPMPFHKRCRIEIENRSPQLYRCYHQINYVLKDVPPDVGYFHAQFRCRLPLSRGEEYVLLDGLHGRGKYVGTALFVGLNGDGNWWGEGEFKFYLDGDTKWPTICGTGTEDYFGGAYDWVVDGTYRTYTGPYMGMHQYLAPDGLFNIQPRFSMYRWHIMDPICFQSCLRVTVQDLGWVELGGDYLLRRDDMASVAYWYQALPATPFPPLPNADEMRFV